MPAEHVAPPPQEMPQPPQLLVSVCSLTQPLVQHDSPTAHAGPPLHVVGAVHTFATHVSPVGHTRPQLPQLFGSLVVLLQPLVQHVSPVVQSPPSLHPVDVQTLATHVSPGGHTMPQPPQLLLSVDVFEHPVAQHAWPTVQAGPPSHEAAGWHWLAAHVLPVGQTNPQLPQFCASSVVSMQTAPQQVSFAGQPVVAQVAAVHSPLTHDSPDAHARPHTPQSLTSVPRFASQPSASIPLQSAKPTEHALMTQRLAEHVVLPFSTAPQTVPQLPQWFGSDVSFAHVAPQHDSPVGHVPFAPQAPTHSPPEHVSPAAHAWPHVPQFSASLPVLVSQPSASTWLQSAKPALHEAMSHALAAHPGVACAYGPHAKPQLPQFSGSVASSTHNGEQHVVPVAHAAPVPQKPTQW